jgi:hypothetical protein
MMIPRESGQLPAVKTWLLAQIEKKRAAASVDSFSPERLAGSDGTGDRAAAGCDAPPRPSTCALQRHSLRQ